MQVIASRLHVAPIMKGRSKCLSCGEALRVTDLIPVISFIWLRGKCRYCKSAYGPSALFIEVLFGIIFLLLYTLILKEQSTLLMSIVWLSYYSVLFVTFGVMALYDKAHSYIPLPFLGAFLALTGGIFIKGLFEEPSSISFFSPLIVALPFLSIWLITKGKGLGFGDVVLFFGVGMFFGVLQGFAVLVISVWFGALFGLYFKVWT